MNENFCEIFIMGVKGGLLQSHFALKLFMFISEPFITCCGVDILYTT